MNDVSPDGQRFLMVRANSASQVVYVEHWFAELLAKGKQWRRGWKLEAA